MYKPEQESVERQLMWHEEVGEETKGEEWERDREITEDEGGRMWESAKRERGKGKYVKQETQVTGKYVCGRLWV